MTKIRIKNFGPIKEGYLENDGWIDIKKVTVLIGNQGSGKSTVAKLISTFTWIEKALVRGDYPPKWFERKNKLKNQYLKYHRIENYFVSTGENTTEIDYRGEAYHIHYQKGNLLIGQSENNSYSLPQIMYVPAERNFIGNVKTPTALKLTSDSLIEFVTEFDNAKNEMKGSLKLPINNVDIEYDKLNDIVNIKGTDYKVRLTEASSGFQSIIPLYLVSWFLSSSVKRQSLKGTVHEPMSSEEIQRFREGFAEIWENPNLTEEQRRVALSVLSSRFNKSAFINIVEEPEQNLFPTSQRQLLNSLLEFNNISEGNQLILTTHSPYVINYLTLVVKGFLVEEKIKYKNRIPELSSKLAAIVPLKSLTKPEDLIIYELDGNGKIVRLGDYKGMPSDENYLNSNLSDGNNLFSSLLDIEDELEES